jgi:rare lipoprotein A
MRASRRAWILPLLLATAGFGLVGCGGGSPEPQLTGPRTRWQAGRPSYQVAAYQVNGVWYRPKVNYNYDETGTASWYGPGFHGKPTSDGEIYDMNQMTAAHKTLPLPSVVEVSNLQNGRAVRLRVNDRGPFVEDRLIDVSRRAAQLLGFVNTGVAPVRVRVLKEESIQVAQAAMRGEFGPAGLAGTAVAAASPAPALAARVQPVRMAAATPPPSLPPSLRATEVIAAPLPVPTPPAPPIPAAPPPAPPVASPQPAPAPTVVAAPRRRPMPSLISSAHAATLPPALAAAKPAASGNRNAGRIFVQAGAFAIPENAQRVRARIASLGHAEIVPGTSRGSALYRVRLGPVGSEAEARRLLSRVVDHGYPEARVVDQ